MRAYHVIAIIAVIFCRGGVNMTQARDVQAPHVLSGAEDAGVSARPSLQSACAAFDLHIVTIMEEAAAAQPASIRLVEATQILLQARAACRDNDALEALRLYSTIDLQRPTRALQPLLGLH